MTNQLNRLQQYISKALFAHSADKNAALELAARLGGTPSGRAEELITQLEAEIVKRDARIVELEHKLSKKVEFMRQLAKDGAKLDDQIAALKAQQPGAGVVDERAAFEREACECYGYTMASIHSRRLGLGYDDSALCMAWIMWQACARLNPCRAQAVPDDREQLIAEADYYRSTLRNVLKDIRDDLVRGGLPPSWIGVAETISVVLNNDRAAPSAQQKESGDE